MGKRAKSAKFFDALYLEPLGRAGNEAARMRLRTQKGLAASAASGPHASSFDRLPKDEHLARSRKGGAARWSKLDPEERRKQLLASAEKMHRLTTPEQRTANAKAGARAVWNVSPEVRAQRLAQAMANIARINAAKRARRVAVWPFPHGQKMSRAEAARIGSAANQAAARLRRFQRRGQC